MSWPGSRGSRRRQGGYSLIELVTVAALLLVVMGTFLTTLESSQRVVPNDVQWSLAIQEGSTGLQRMVRELRQAVAVYATTPNSIDFQVTLGGQARRVLYRCDVAQTGTPYRECVRIDAALGTPLPGITAGEPVVLRVLNGTAADPVFSFTPSGLAPTFVTLTLRLPARGEQPTGAGYAHAIVLADGAFLRNQALGG